MSVRLVFTGLALTLCLASSISPQSGGDCQSTQNDLERLLHKWQDRLGLNGWKIEAHLVSQNSLNAEGTGEVLVADVSYDTRAFKAVVRVERGRAADVEESLVHELVHIELDAWSPPADPAQEEDTVEAIAHALLTQKSE